LIGRLRPETGERKRAAVALPSFHPAPCWPTLIAFPHLLAELELLHLPVEVEGASRRRFFFSRAGRAAGVTMQSQQPLIRRLLRARAPIFAERGVKATACSAAGGSEKMTMPSCEHGACRHA